MPGLLIYTMCCLNKGQIMYLKFVGYKIDRCHYFSKRHFKIKQRKQILAILANFTNEHITNAISITYLNGKKIDNFHNLRNSLFIKYFIVQHLLAS